MSAITPKHLGEREDTEKALAFLDAFYTQKGLKGASAKEKIAFLRGHLHYEFCAGAVGPVSEKGELAGLERALINEEL